jgi:hypothetical protein
MSETTVRVPAAEQDKPITGASRGQALACYKPPFRFQTGYIFDAENRMVADVPEKDAILAILRVRGWGRLQYRTDCDPEALQDMIGILIAEALTQFWERERQEHGCPECGRVSRHRFDCGLAGREGGE